MAASLVFLLFSKAGRERRACGYECLLLSKGKEQCEKKEVSVP